MAKKKAAPKANKKTTKAKAAPAKKAAPKKAAAKKAAPKKSAPATLGGVVRVIGQTVKEFEGNTVINDNSVSVTFKKPRSSKFITQTFANGSYVAAFAGEEGYVVAAGALDLVDPIEVADINNDVEFSDGYVTVTDVEGNEIVIMLVPGVTVEVESAPNDGDATTESKPKKAASKKAKKEEPEEDEDEDEEDEDEEDEDEDEEDEDEEDEDEDEEDDEDEDDEDEDEDEDDDDWEQD